MTSRPHRSRRARYLAPSQLRRIAAALAAVASCGWLGCASRSHAVFASAPPDSLSPRPAPESPPSPRTVHVVQAGETAYRIAQRFGISVEALASANGLTDPTRLIAGQRLLIPATTDSPRETARSGAMAHSAESAREAADGLTPVSLVLESEPTREADQPLLPNGARWSWPIDGELGGGFGAPRRKHAHTGLDLLAPAGTTVRASRSGLVQFVGSQGAYGLMVIVDHGDDQSSYYAHLRRALVVAGDQVEAGQPLGECGKTGNATTPHLHFEIRRDGVPIDPQPLLAGRD